MDKKQVSIIQSDVESARLTIINLSQELIDHICCEVESLMNKGKSFDEAYAEVKQQTGIQVLQKIQDNTLYLIDKNYRIMKTTMKITGNVSLILLSLGTLFKIQHWPGAGVLLLFGFVLLSFVFFPTAVYVNQKEGGVKRNGLLSLSLLLGGMTLIIGILFKVQHWPSCNLILTIGWGIILVIFLPTLMVVRLNKTTNSTERMLTILGVLSLMIFEAGALFKFMHWQGAAVLLILGSVLLVGLFLPIYSYHKFKETRQITGQFIFLIIISMYVVSFTTLISINLSQPVLEGIEKEADNAAKITTYIENKMLVTNKQLNLSDSAKINILQLSNMADTLCNTLESIKVDLIGSADGVDENTAVKSAQKPELIVNKGNSNYQISAFSTEKTQKDIADVELGYNKLMLMTNNTSITTNKLTVESITNHLRGNTLIGSIDLINIWKRNIRTIELNIAENRTNNTNLIK